MLIPRKVEEVIVTVPKTLYDRVVRELAKAGIFHADEPPREVSKLGSRQYMSLYIRVSEKASKLESYYKALGLDPERKRVRIEARTWEEALERLESQYKSLEEEFDRRLQRLSELEAEEQDLQALKALLEPIQDIDVDIREASDSEFIGYAIGYLPAEKGVGEVERIAVKRGVLAAIEERGELLLVAVAGEPGKVSGFVRDARSLGWTPIVIPEHLPGSPAKAYTAVVERLSKIIEEREKLIEALRARKGELDHYYSGVRGLLQVAKLLASTVFTRTMAVFRGFVDTRDSKKLRRSLDEATGGAYVVTSLGVRRAGERVPTKVELPRFIKPFHKLVEMYGEPDADEIVPTVFVAITMPLIFALMFPDMGHGLLVLLFALWYFKRRDPDWRYILSVLGAASIVTGFLAAEFFGPIGAKLVGLPHLWEKLGFHTPPLAQPTFAVEEGLGPEVSRELLLNIASIALWLGGFMLTLGTLLGVVDYILKGDKIHAVTSRLPMFLFFLSATLPFLATGNVSEAGGILMRALMGGGPMGPMEYFVKYGILVAIVWILIGEPLAAALHGESPKSGLGHAILEVYELFLMVMGNIPSFLRILGLGLAHAGLMLGFAQLYYLIAGSQAIPHILGVIFGGIVYIIGNLMVVALEAIIAFAHSLRLHFYEWFSKFYSGSGVKFEPVKLEGVEIIVG